MAVPSRVYVGVVVFGLIVVLPILAYATLLLVGFQPPPETPYELLFPEEPVRDWGQIVFLSIAILFSLAFTWFAWRALVQGARLDAAKRREITRLKREIRRVKRGRHQRMRPPGNT